MPKKRSTRSVRLLQVCVVVFVLLLAAATFNYFRPLPTITGQKTLQLSAITTADSVSWPTSAEAALGAVNYGVLASQGPQTELPTASVAKLITALAVLQKYPLQVGQQGPTISLTSADVALYQHYLAEDGSVVAVQAGEQITEYQALEAMMLPSANNIADSLAIWAFGSLSSYASFANQFVATLGLTQTHIGSDASGFLPDTTASAEDLVRLGLVVLKNPVLSEIIAKPSTVLPVAGTVTNVNALLGTDNIIGIKTGNSDQAGGVYLFAASDSIDASHTVTIVGAIANSADLQTAFGNAIPLLDSAKQNFILANVVHAGQVVGSYHTPWKTTITAVAQQGTQAVVWNGTVPKVSLSLLPITGVRTSRSVVGKLSVSTTTNSTSSAVVLSGPLARPPFFWRLLRHNL
jgi:serine-type D-Ala-D-Ala carboxypeptidase (penicillin-binding protein 5/6)